MTKIEEGLNKRFERLIVKEIIKEKGKKTKYRCICDCGNEIITENTNIWAGKVKSCGCMLKENRDKVKKGELKHYTKHNMTGDRLLRIRNGMISRCYYKRNDSYKNYGGRGIKVCDEWKNKNNGSILFIKWAKENGYYEHVKRYGEKNTTIDRIDVNGNYEPNNCRWATLKEQMLNIRPYEHKKGYIKENALINGNTKKYLLDHNICESSVRRYIKRNNCSLNDAVNYFLQKITLVQCIDKNK